MNIDISFAAVIAAAVALMAGDLITAKTRLRRNLDKDLAIIECLPDGFAKTRLQRIVERDSLALVHRSEKVDELENHTWWWASLAVGIGVIALSVTFQLTGSTCPPGAAQATPSTCRTSAPCSVC